MGYFCNHAIVVSGFQYDENNSKVHEAREKAVRFFRNLCEVSPVVNSRSNGMCSFFIPPDGSKEGWDTSNSGDLARTEYLNWLKGQPELDWAEIKYGDEEHMAELLDCSDWEKSGRYR